MQNRDNELNYGYCVDSFLVERNLRPDLLVQLLDTLAKKANEYGLKGVKIDRIFMTEDIKQFGHITVDFVSNHYPQELEEEQSVKPV